MQPKRKTNSTPHKRTSAPQRKSETRGATRKWSADVTEHSDALDLKEGVFKSNDPDAIARSVKRSAERSHRRKASPFRSALSMLTFYINRAGKNLSARRRRTLMAAKDSLRKLFGRKPAPKRQLKHE